MDLILWPKVKFFMHALTLQAESQPEPPVTNADGDIASIETPKMSFSKCSIKSEASKNSLKSTSASVKDEASPEVDHQ